MPGSISHKITILRQVVFELIASFSAKISLNKQLAIGKAPFPGKGLPQRLEETEEGAEEGMRAQRIEFTTKAQSFGFLSLAVRTRAISR